MDRKKALEVLSQIFECKGLDGNAITLMPSEARGLLAKGYQIHISAHLSEEARDCIKKVIEKHGLKFHEGGERLMIYTPANGEL